MRKVLFFIGVAVIVLGGAVFVSRHRAFPIAPENSATISEHVLPKEIDTEKPIPISENTSSSIKILFTGDLMLDRGVEYYIKKIGGGDYIFPFVKIKTYLDSFDAVISNLEGPVSDKGINQGSIYSFRMDPKIFEIFPYANIKAVNVANNHAWDYGPDAFFDTLSRLKNQNVGYFGGGMNEAEAYAPYVFEKNGIRVCILGFTEFLEHAEANDEHGGIAFIDTEKIKSVLQKTKQSDCDALIVVFHFGEEYIPEPVERQKNIAHRAIDEGADLVVGHHPHVVESSEMYKGKHIFYSLGNFIFDQGFSKETMIPGFLEVAVSKDGIISAALKKGSMTNYFEVIPPEK